MNIEKLEGLLTEVTEEVHETEEDYNKLKRALNSCEEELSAKKRLKNSIEFLLKLNN